MTDQNHITAVARRVCAMARTNPAGDIVSQREAEALLTWVQRQAARTTTDNTENALK